MSVTVANLSGAMTQTILRSAHAVSIDRNGCAARADAKQLAGPPISAHPKVLLDSELLPASTQQLSVCWYVSTRLVASALLDGPATRRVLTATTGMASEWPSRPLQPSLPACEDVAKTDGVLLLAHTAGRSDRIAVADFADCGEGQSTTRSVTADFMSDSRLAMAIRKASGIPIALGYRATN